MSFLAYLILTAVVLGVGSLVASLLPTRGTRIGLGAVVVLALIVDSTWLLAPITNWSAALADAIWVGVCGFIFLAVAVNAKLRFRMSSQRDLTWPSARDLTFLALIVTWFGATLLVLPVPFGSDAQGFGYLALTLREGGDYSSLAPWHPEINYLYSPAFTGMIAHLSARFDLGIHTLQLVFGAVTASLFVWAAYDLGCELAGPRTGRGFMLATLIGTGLVSVFMDSHFTALLALIFALAFISFVVAFLRTGAWSSALLAAICLAGVPLGHQDMAIALIIGYAPWLIIIWFGRPRPSLKIWLGLAVMIPLAALLIVSPWLISITDLLVSDIRSPYLPNLNLLQHMVITQGGLCIILVVIGARVGYRRRQPILLWMIVWVVGLVEFSTFGVLAVIFPDLKGTLFKYNYPLGLAWNGPLIPYTVLGGTGLVWLADRLDQDRIDRLVRRLAAPVMALLLLTLGFGVVFFDSLPNTSKVYRNYKGCFSSAADVEAMLWLRDNVPQNARILNHPGPAEGDWAPIVTERDTIYFRPQHFFQNTHQTDAEQDAFRGFWNDPTNPEYESLFRTLGVSYVLVPQVFGDPTSLKHMTRWINPLPMAAAYPAIPFEDIPYLRLVYERDGAQVYEVITSLAQDHANSMVSRTSGLSARLR